MDLLNHSFSYKVFLLKNNQIEINMDIPARKADIAAKTLQFVKVTSVQQSRYRHGA